MSKYKKLFEKVILKENDSISFLDFQYLIEKLGFSNTRITGDHFIYRRSDVPIIVNIQPDENMAKKYQVEQFRNIVKKYCIKGDDDNEK